MKPKLYKVTYKPDLTSEWDVYEEFAVLAKDAVDAKWQVVTYLKNNAHAEQAHFDKWSAKKVDERYPTIVTSSYKAG